jgi:aminoglycoside phosphotransferase (APT) family kinase protein
VLAAELLDVMRAATGDSELAYAEPPVRLEGGFFTENHAFRLSGSTPSWSGPLVLRLFPSVTPAEQPRREASTQKVLCEQGYPAPRVVLFDEAARLDGRRFFVMERLAGRPMIGGIRIHELSGSGLRLFRQVPDVTARVQAALHGIDATALASELHAMPVGVERWFATLEAQIEAGADGLRGALEWLREHRPPTTQRQSICHGDLWGGNILVEHGDVTGVLDWSTVTIAEPALDVGFTTMSLSLAPIDAPRSVQRVVARLGSWMATRYVRAYQRETNADLSHQPYYEALRCASELSWVAAYRLAEQRGEPHDTPRLTWDTIADRMIDYFRARTGVTLSLPPAVSR